MGITHRSQELGNEAQRDSMPSSDLLSSLFAWYWVVFDYIWRLPSSLRKGIELPCLFRLQT